MDRMKQLSKGGASSIPNGSSNLNGIAANRLKMNTEMRMEKLKLDANRRVRDQKRNFNRRSSEKQVIEERRKRREARIIETKVRNESRARINANNRAKRAEAAKNREYENKKRFQLKADINSKRVTSLQKNYTNLKAKTANTLNKYTLRKKLADTQMSNSLSKVKALDKKLTRELERADIERDMGKKLQSDLNAVTLQVEKSEQRVGEIETERDQLNVRIKDIQSRLEVQAKSGSVMEVERLTTELNKAKADIEKLTNEVTTLTNKTETAVASATKELNLKLARAIKNKNNAATAATAETTRRGRNSKVRKRSKLNTLLTNIGVTNKTALMNEYNTGIKNGKDPNEMINSIVKRARETDKEAARASAGLTATAIAKASMQNELNRVKTEKEAALREAAANKNKAVKNAKIAERALVNANTVTEREKAKRNLVNAQAKINAANANKTQALANAKTERNAALMRVEQNKNAALMGAARNANVAKKELNAIRFQKEAALAKAATEKISAVAAAEKAAREATMAETATEKAAAEQKLKNAQAKINAANANKKQALANAKTERNATLLRAEQNKNAVLKKSALTEAKYKAARSEMNSKNAALKKAGNNKNVELASARMVAAATARAEAQAELNAIRMEKEAALALANAEKKKAVAMAEEAAKAKAAANTQAEKNAAEKQAEKARKARELAAKQVTNALEKAAAERKRVEIAKERMKSILVARAQKARNTVQKRSNEKAAGDKAAANTQAERNAAEKKTAEAKRLRERIAAKLRATQAMIDAKSKAKAEKAGANAELLKRQREAVQVRMAAVKAKADANAMVTKKVKVVKMRKILATYRGADPTRKATVVSQGEDLIKQYENGKMMQIELGITKLVRNAKTRNAENATKKLTANQTTKAANQFATRKKNLARRLTAAAAKDTVTGDVKVKQVKSNMEVSTWVNSKISKIKANAAKRRALNTRPKGTLDPRERQRAALKKGVNIKMVKTNPLFNKNNKRNFQFENAIAKKGVMRTNPLAFNSDITKKPIPSYKNILQKQNPGMGVVRPVRMADSTDRVIQRRRIEKMKMGPERVRAARALASNISRNAARTRTIKKLT